MRKPAERHMDCSKDLELDTLHAGSKIDIGYVSSRNQGRQPSSLTKFTRIWSFMSVLLTTVDRLLIRFLGFSLVLRGLARR